jgi:hypothetical protein
MVPRAGFPKLLQRWELHDALLKKKSKRLARHLEKEGVITSSYSSKWFMQCFQDKVRAMPGHRSIGKLLLGGCLPIIYSTPFS